METMTLLEKLGLAIKRMQDRHHKAVDARLAPLGISLVQWHALREIKRYPGSPQLRLAELTFNSAQAFGTLTTRMLQAGLITRESGVGRAYCLSLTDKGETLLEQGRGEAQAVLAESFSGLSEEECAVMLRLLDKALAVV
jgi:DNA-binding MarR family transcriptional regulator